MYITAYNHNLSNFDNIFCCFWDETKTNYVEFRSYKNKEAEKFKINFSIPGFAKDEIKISTSGNTLTVEGENNDENQKNDNNYLKAEVTHNTFKKTIELPYDLEVHQTSANLKNGILKLEIPISESQKAKVISIQE